MSNLTQTLVGVCEMSTSVMRVRTFGGGSGNREIVLLNDNHTVILLLFSGCEGVCDDSCPALRTFGTRFRFKT